MMAMGKNDLDRAYRYTWDWFQYHAKQRIATFNIFLIIMGAIGYGYGWSYVEGKMDLCVIAGIFGALISVAFLMIEIRNTMLVSDGRQALDKIEKIMPYKKLEIRRRDYERKWYYIIIKHTFWLRLILSISFASSVLAALYARSRADVHIIITLYFIALIIFLISISQSLDKREY